MLKFKQETKITFYKNKLDVLYVNVFTVREALLKLGFEVRD